MQSSGARCVGSALSGTAPLAHSEWSSDDRQRSLPLDGGGRKRKSDDCDCHCGSGRHTMNESRGVYQSSWRSVFSACARWSPRFNGARNRTLRRGVQNVGPADGQQLQWLWQPNRFYLAHSRCGIAVSAADRERWSTRGATISVMAGKNRGAQSEGADGVAIAEHSFCRSDSAVDCVSVC